MTHDLTDQYWEAEFNITIADLERILEKIRECRCPFVLSELAVSVIQNRLEKGVNISPAVLAERTGRPSIKSWDALSDWQIGDGVILIRDKNLYDETTKKDIVIVIGEVIDIQKQSHVVYIKDDQSGDTIRYSYSLVEDEKTQNIREKTRQIIAERYLSDDIAKKAEGVLLKHPIVGDRMRDALRNTPGFLELENKWFLSELTIPLDEKELVAVHHVLLQANESLSPTDLQKRIDSTRPKDELELFSLHRSLLDDRRARFINEGQIHRPSWRAVPPPPPPWEKATACYAIYDPETYKVLTLPGTRLSQSTAKRLQALGLYDDLVEWSND